MKKFILCVAAILQFIVLFGHTNSFIPSFNGIIKSEINTPPTVLDFVYLNFRSIPATGGNLVGTELIYDPILGTGIGTYDDNNGIEKEVTAFANPGFKFAYWTYSGTETRIISDDNGYTQDNIYYFHPRKLGDHSFDAHFNLIVTATPNTISGGTVSGTGDFAVLTGSGDYAPGSNVTLSATPTANWEFVSWTDVSTGLVVSTDANYTFPVNGPVNLVANFKLITFDITTIINPISGGSSSGAGTYSIGTTVVLIATPAIGYAFVSWTEGVTVVSTSPGFLVTADMNHTFQANFIKQYYITVVASPTNGGSTTPSGYAIYDIGTKLQLMATPASGFRFVSWAEGLSVISTVPSFQITVDADRTLWANFMQQFNIVTNSNPTSGGSTSGSGIYDINTPVTLTATPTSGYRFVNWTEGGTVVSTISNYLLIADKNRTLVANFIQRFNIVANTTTGGTASGTGIYDAGASVVLSATALTGYAFINWTEGGVVVSTNPSLSFTADKDRTLVANFSQRFNIVANATTGGIATGAGIYNAGASVVLSATALTGYAFINWTEGGVVVATNPSLSFTADKDRTLVANFIQKFTITANATSGGSTTGSGLFDAGASVVLSATALTGYAFINWTEGGVVVSTDPSLSFTANKDRTLVANFIQRFNIVANSTAGGSASGTGIYNAGTTVALSATALMGYAFANWTESGVVVSTDPSLSFTADKDRTLVANFIQRFNIVANSTAGGSASGTGVYDAGASVILSATPLTGYAFVNWTEGGVVVSTNPSLSFTANEDRTLVANFIQRFNIIANSTPGGSASGTGIYDTGASVVLSATALTGYAFINWTEGGVVVSTDPSFSFTADKDRTLVANFSQRFNIVANATTGGTTTGTGIYDAGTTIALSATALTGYAFVNWTEGGIVVSSVADYSFTANKDRTLVANFIQRFNIVANTTTGGTASGTGVYDAGASVILSATPLTGYAFVNWTEGSIVVSSVADYSFTANKDRTLVANFSQRFNIVANATTGGTATGAGIYNAGASVVLSATALTGYAFINWTEGGVVVSTDPSLSFTADKDRTLVANFIQRFNIVANFTPGGTASGTGVYDAGASVILSATPLTGYTFINWTESGVVVSTDPSLSFTADKDRTLVANFIQRFNIVANTTTGGTASGTGIYNAGASVTLSATALTGYAFVNWTEGGVVVSTDPSFSFSADKDRTLVANFIQRFNIVANFTPGGTASGTGVYDAGASVILSATPLTGYTLINWTESGVVVSTDPSLSFTANKDRTLVANFIQRFNIVANATTGGSVSGTGIYDAGTTVALSATPLTGYTFVNWTEGGIVVSSVADYSFTANKDRTLVANFIQRFNIVANFTPGGTASGTGVYDAGASVILSATPLTGYTFINWTEGGVVVSTDPSLSFTANKDRTLVANFIQRFNIIVNTTTGGTASGTGIYNAGASVTLLATALTGYAFTNWTEGGVVVSTDPSLSFTANKDRTLVANFIQRFNIVANTTTGGTASGTGIYDAGTKVNLSATPLADYIFVNWTEDGSIISTTPVFTITTVKDRTFQANFKLKTFTIIASVLPSGGGTITDDKTLAAATFNQTFSMGDNVKLTAVPTTGFDFVNWTEDGTDLNVITPVYSFSVNKDRVLKANFIRKTYTIKAYSYPSDGGLISKTGFGNGTASFSATYAYGAEVNLTAIQSSCFEFVNWTESNVIVSLNSNYTFVATGDRTFIVNFASPTPLKIKSSDSVCMGEAMNFELISDNLKNNLAWDFGDGKAATGSSVSHTFASTGYFKVTVKSTDATICLANTYKMIKVYTTSLNLDLKDTIACSPFHLSRSISSKKDKLLWNFGDDNTWYSKCDKIYVNKEDKPVRRKVTVVTDNDQGCNTTLSFYVTINPSPKSSIEYYTKPGRPEILVYKNKSVLSDSCEWDLPDGTRQYNKDSIIQQFKQNGFYRILLKSTNKYGCTDTTSVSHRTILTGLYVPNAFRPESGDHKVNCFKPIGTGLKSCDMSIYDLWGNLVRQAKCDDNLESFEGWNGKSKNGTPLPVGVYIWRIKAVFQDGTEWKGNPDEKGKCRTEGNITLLR